MCQKYCLTLVLLYWMRCVIIYPVLLVIYDRNSAAPFRCRCFCRRALSTISNCSVWPSHLLWMVLLLMRPMTRPSPHLKCQMLHSMWCLVHAFDIELIWPTRCDRRLWCPRERNYPWHVQDVEMVGQLAPTTSNSRRRARFFGQGTAFVNAQRLISVEQE